MSVLLDHMVSVANGLLARPLAIELTEAPVRTTRGWSTGHRVWLKGYRMTPSGAPWDDGSRVQITTEASFPCRVAEAIRAALRLGLRQMGDDGLGEITEAEYEAGGRAAVAAKVEEGLQLFDSLKGDLE